MLIKDLSCNSDFWWKSKLCKRFDVCTVLFCNHSNDFCLASLTVLRCQVLSPPANGKLESGVCGNVLGRVCRMQCNRGYQLKGSVARTCEKVPGTDQEVRWTGNGTYCEGEE